MMNDRLPRAPRVLVVEDDEISRICLVALLTRMGYEVEEAITGGQAVEFMRRHCFDLVVMDLHLPDGPAEDRLAELQPLDTSPPIFAVTTRVTIERTGELFRAGFSDYLLKPVSAETLTAKMAAHSGNPGRYLRQLSHQITSHLEHHLPAGIRLIKKFLAELPGQLKAVQSALNQNRREEAVEIVHKLHGAAGFIGFSELERVADRLEETLQEAETSLQKAAWEEVEKEAQRLLASGDDLLEILNQEAYHLSLLSEGSGKCSPDRNSSVDSGSARPFPDPEKANR